MNQQYIELLARNHAEKVAARIAEESNFTGYYTREVLNDIALAYLQCHKDIMSLPLMQRLNDGERERLSKEIQSLQVEIEQTSRLPHPYCIPGMQGTRSLSECEVYQNAHASEANRACRKLLSFLEGLFQNLFINI